MGVRLALVAVAATLFLMAVAQAFGASVDSAPGIEGGPDPTVTYRAEAGERNSLSDAADEAGNVRVRDAGAVVRAGQRCQNVDVHAVLCEVLRTGVTMAVDVFTGDGDDRVRLAIAGDQAWLGRGDDTAVVVSRTPISRVSVFGGPGADRLVGATGKAGDDNFLWGGKGDDRISGRGGDDLQLSGGHGDDRINGGSGDDDFAGGPGRDRLNGGSGDDNIRARDGVRDRVACGKGRDRVRADRVDVLVGCERVFRGELTTADRAVPSR